MEGVHVRFPLDLFEEGFLTEFVGTDEEREQVLDFGAFLTKQKVLGGAGREATEYARETHVVMNGWS